MNARWSLIALALIATLVIWFASRSGREPQSPELQRSSSSAADAASPSASAAELPESTTRDAAPRELPAAATSEAALRAPSALRVRALDHEGRPLPGARFVVYGAFWWKRQRESTPALWRAEADAQGRASWAEVGPELEKHAASGGLAVTLEGFVPHVAPVFLPSAQDLAEEHVLRAPAFGGIVLRVVDPLGQPLRTGFATLIARTERGISFGDQARRDDPAHAPIQDGTVRFPFVGIGVPLRALCSPNAGLEVVAEAPALSSPGEEREILLAFGSDRVVLRLRICDETGRPIADRAHVNVRREIDGRGGLEGPIQTAEDGVLWVDLPPSEPRPCKVELFLRGSLNSEDAGSGSVRVNVARTTGLVDLGDVLLQRGPLAVSGRVLLPDGAPAAGARLQAAFTAVASDSTGPRPFVDLPIRDAEGRFAWHENQDRATAETQVKLQAWLDREKGARFVAREQVVPLGSTEVEVRLEALGTISGTWRAGAPWSHGDFEVRLDPENAVTTAHGSVLGDVTPNGFGFPAQLAGRYTVRLSAQGTPLLEIKGLVVRAGETCDDPRLRDIDLSPKVILLAYEIVAPPGDTGPRNGALFARPAGEAGAAWTKRSLWTKEARIVVPRGRYDVVLVVQRAQVVRFTDVEQGRRVELAASMPVELALEGRPEGLAEGEHLRARLAMELDGIPLEVDSERFAPDGTARMGIPAPGRYGVSWRRERDRGNGVDSQPWSTTTSTIEIDESSSSQRVVVPAPRAQ